MEQTTPPYFLAKHAHLCLAADAVVILDVAAGTYLALDRRMAASLGGFIAGWPVPADGSPAPAVLRSLVDRRLVTQDPALGKPARCPRLELPRHWVREGEPRGRPAITVRNLRTFLASVACAACSKKFLRFEQTVARARSRTGARQQDGVDVERLASLVRIFDWLRPIAFRKTDECFLYCLAMREFLSRHGIVPSWVFAVRTDPFVAHCWLQQGDLVLTDIPFNLRRMVPILVL